MKKFAVATYYVETEQIFIDFYYAYTEAQAIGIAEKRICETICGDFDDGVITALISAAKAID